MPVPAGSNQPWVWLAFLLATVGEEQSRCALVPGLARILEDLLRPELEG